MIENTKTIEEHAAGFLGAAVVDESFTITEVSNGVVTIGQYSREEVVGLTMIDVLHPDDLDRGAAAMLEVSRTQEPTVDGIYRMLKGDGKYQDFAIRADPTREDGQSRFVLKFAEVSDVLRADEFARDAVETLRLLGESRELDPCLERIHRLAERHVPDVSLAISTLKDGVTRTHRRLPDRSFSVDVKPTIVPANVTNALARHADGPWRAFNRMAEFELIADGAMVTSILIDDTDELLGYVEVTRQSSTEPHYREWMVHGLVRQVLTALLRRLRVDEQLRDAADNDPLTGLANRRRLLRDMEADDTLGGTTLLLIDLDNFSWINNTLGHQVGDQTLVALAERLRELCPAASTIARFSGDEFVVWFPGPISELANLARELRTTTIGHPETAERRATVRCSIGAIVIQAGESATSAINRADKAMYTAKNSGGDSMHIC